MPRDHTDYTFFDMLREMFSSKEDASGEFRDDNDAPIGGGGSYPESSSSTSGDFDPSDAAGEGFRSIFGDDNG